MGPNVWYGSAKKKKVYFFFLRFLTSFHFVTSLFALHGTSFCVAWHHMHHNSGPVPILGTNRLCQFSNHTLTSAICSVQLRHRLVMTWCRTPLHPFLLVGKNEMQAAGLLGWRCRLVFFGWTVRTPLSFGLCDWIPPNLLTFPPALESSWRDTLNPCTHLSLKDFLETSGCSG